jgi:hypothetical protein
MNLSPYITAGFDLLKNETVTINGAAIPCIFNATTSSDLKQYGYTAGDTCTIVVRTSDLTTHPRNHLKTKVFITNVPWIISESTAGGATTQFLLTKP